MVSVGFRWRSRGCSPATPPAATQSRASREALQAEGSAGVTGGHPCSQAQVHPPAWTVTPPPTPTPQRLRASFQTLNTSLLSLTATSALWPRPERVLPPTFPLTPSPCPHDAPGGAEWPPQPAVERPGQREGPATRSFTRAPRSVPPSRAGTGDPGGPPGPSSSP